MLLLAACFSLVNCKSYRYAQSFDDTRLTEAEAPVINIPVYKNSYAYEKGWSSWSSWSTNWDETVRNTVSTKGINVIRSFGGNSAGAQCYFPFVYRGQTYNSCTSYGRTDTLEWCSTTPSYDRDQRYGFCNLHPVTTTVMTSEGRCEFPFIFKRKVYHGCTTDGMDDGRSWCSLDWDYDGRRRWGICPTATVPDTTEHQETYRTVVTKTNIQEKANTRVNSRLKKVETFAGNSENKPCAMSYTFQGRLYSGCTTDGRSDNLKWCATTENYDRDFKWGFCVEHDYPKSLLTENRFFCAFPFIYGTKAYYGCTTDGRTDGRKWCSLTHDYSKGRSWSFCPDRAAQASRRFSKQKGIWKYRK